MANGILDFLIGVTLLLIEGMFIVFFLLSFSVFLVFLVFVFGSNMIDRPVTISLVLCCVFCRGLNSFDTFLGYYIGEEDYYTHTRASNGVQGIDLRKQEEGINCTGNYSAYLFGNETIEILKSYQIQLKKTLEEKKEFQQQKIKNIDTNIHAAAADDDDYEPFFLYLPFQNVHAPLQAPQQFINEYNDTIKNDKNRQIKAGMVGVLDSVLGEILTVLKQNVSDNSTISLWDNTIIIVSSDNGGPLQDGANNYPLRGSKDTLWEGGVRGVGFVNGGILPLNRRGEISNEMIHITDWLPTLANIAGFIPYGSKTDPRYIALDGFDMTDVLFNETAVSKRDTILHNIDPLNCTIPICGAIRYVYVTVFLFSELYFCYTLLYLLYHINT